MIYSIEHITRILKSARLKKGLSQRELGEKTGLPQSHISRIENGEVDLKTSSLIEISRVLGLELKLVSRSLVPTVEGFERNFHNQNNIVSQTPLNTLKNIKKVQKDVEQIAQLFSENKEVKRLASTINQFGQIHINNSEATKLNKLFEELNPQIKSIKESQNKLSEFINKNEFMKEINEINQISRELGKLRNEIVHGVNETIASTIPLYQLDEEDV